MIRSVSPDKWPRPGFALLPARYRRLWYPERVPAEIVEAAGLPSGLRLGDLDASVWEDVDPTALLPLANYVLHLINTRIYYRSDPDAALAPILLNGWSTRASPKELPFAPRTLNALTRSNRLSDTDWLGSASAEDLLGIRGAGALTLLDFATLHEGAGSDTAVEDSHERLRGEMSQELELLETEYPIALVSTKDPRLAHLGLSGPSLADALRVLTEDGDPHRASLLVKAVRHELEILARQSLPEALSHLVRAVVPQHVETLTRRLGWDGGGGSTLQRAAEDVGISRARVHQLEKKLRSAAARVDFMPSLDAALEKLTEATAHFDPDLATVLARHGLATGRFEPHGVITAAEFVERETGLKEVGGLLVLVGDEDSGPAISQALRSLTDVNHVAPVAELQARIAEATGDDLTMGDVRSILQRTSRVVWLDADRDWFWDGRETRYINIARKVLSVANPISIEALRLGVLRHHRTRNMSLPRKAFEGLCRAAGFGVTGFEVSVDPAIDPGEVLGVVELTMLSVISSGGNVMGIHELRDSCVSRGVNRHSFWVYVSYSPILDRLAPGVYAVRGLSVDPARVAELAGRPSRSAPALQDHGWTKDGAIWMGYAVTSSLFDSGVVSIPAGIRRVVGDRRLELFSIDGSPMGTLVVGGGNGWGLTPFINRRGVDVGDHLVILMDTELEVAIVQTGSSDLVLTYQEGDGWGPRRFLESVTAPEVN